MATLVIPSNLQKIEYNATTAEGPCRVTIVNGTMELDLQAVSPGGAAATESGSFKALLDPSLTPGQFRRAIGTASLATICHHVGEGLAIVRRRAAFEKALFVYPDAHLEMRQGARIILKSKVEPPC